MSHLRRISDSIRQQNWSSVFIDVAVVVLGVFLGLQVNNWNQARISNRTSQTYYARLIDDLRAEQSSRTARIEYYKIAQKHAERAIALLSQPDKRRGEQFLVDAYQATQVWNYTPQRTTYDELLSGGIANAIPDPTLRSRLANFYTSLEISRLTQQERTPYRDNLRRHMPHLVQAKVRQECGDTVEIRDNGIVYLVLPATCNVVFDSTTVTDANRALRSYVDFEQDLNRHLADLDSRMLSLQSFLEPTGEIVSVLENLIR